MLRALAAAVIAVFLVVHPAAWAACPDPVTDPISAAVSAAVQARVSAAVVAAVTGVSDDESYGQENEEDDDEEASQPDTTIAVRPGIGLEIENFGGTITVKTWDKDLLQIAADHSLRARVIIERDGSTLRLKVKSRRWPTEVRYRIVAPRWMKLELSGVNTDIDVEDSRGEIHAETVQGDINVNGGGGFTTLRSIQGEVVAKGIRGRIEASSVNQGVRLANVVGPIFAESVNGAIMIEGAQSDSVQASTVNGPVTFEGQVSDGGFYRFSTHNGCIDVAMPERSNATVSLSTFSGGIDSSFPVTLKKIRSRRFQTTLGTGRAQFELESFQGTIFLRRPSEARSNCDADDDDEGDGKEQKAMKAAKEHKHDKADESDSDDKGDE